MLTKQEVISALADFAGPLGPLESYDEQLDRREHWIATADNHLIDILLEILLAPPSEGELQFITPENFKIELSEILLLMGQRDPLNFLRKIGPLLSNNQARPTVIELIGALGLREGIDWLEPLVNNLNSTQNQSLTEDELIRLACALGEIGRGQARLLLERMQTSHSNQTTKLQKEIEIALELCSSFSG